MAWQPARGSARGTLTGKDHPYSSFAPILDRPTSLSMRCYFEACLYHEESHDAVKRRPKTGDRRLSKSLM